MPKQSGMMKRAKTRIRFGNEDMDFVFLWMLGYGAYGGLSVGEGFYAASGIQDGHPESWRREFTAHGERRERGALREKEAGHVDTVSGGPLLLRRGHGPSPRV